MRTTKRFTVAICGGGIGGLTAAIALSRYPDIDVTIYEAANRLTEVGAGLGLFPRVWDIIRDLGLDQDLLATTDIQLQDGPVPSFRLRKSDQPEGFEFFTLVTHGNVVTLHRADFQGTLLRHLPKSCRVHCSKRLSSYSRDPSGVISLFFEDGSKAQCDILVGADGFKSAVRRCMMGEKAIAARREGRTKDSAEFLGAADPLWSGTCAYRALISAEHLRAKAPGHRALTTPTQYLGKNGFVIAYPIQSGKSINCAVFQFDLEKENSRINGPWVGHTDKAQFVHLFAHWEPEVHALIECTSSVMRWSIPTVKPMKTFVHGTIALLGDAAHAMDPHQGSGAGQAVEDAFILSKVLGHRSTTRETLGRALKVYDEIRRPFALRIQEKSRLSGRYFSLNCDDLDFENASEPQLRDRLHRLGKEINQNWEWTWTTSVSKSVEDAIRMLES